MTRDDLKPMGELAGTIAHDLNNLLAGIRGYAELAQQGVAENDQALGDLEQLQHAVGRGEELARQLQEFSHRLLEASGAGRPEALSTTEMTLQRLLAEAGLQDA
jgi:signal transduction histidine kinase